jgi:hypothetical protein
VSGIGDSGVAESSYGATLKMWLDQSFTLYLSQLFIINIITIVPSIHYLRVSLWLSLLPHSQNLDMPDYSGLWRLCAGSTYSFNLLVGPSYSFTLKYIFEIYITISEPITQNSKRAYNQKLQSKKSKKSILRLWCNMANRTVPSSRRLLILHTISRDCERI